MGAFKNDLETATLERVEEIAQKNYLCSFQELPPHLKFVVYEIAEELARIELSGN